MKEISETRRFINRLRRGAIKKSLIASFTVALSVIAVCSAFGWYYGFDKLWVYAVVFFGVALAAFPLFYLLKYRKSEKAVAQAIDSLGLEERMLTMESLKGVDTYIARRQREDTMAALSQVSEKRLSLLLSTALLACFAVALPLGAGFTTVSALSANGILPSGREVAEGVPAKYTLSYTASEGGSLQGATQQYVTENTSGSYVIAEADDGYIFVKWSDGLKSNVRCDTPTDDDIKVKAIFESLEDYNADEEMFGPEIGKDPNGDNKGQPEKSNPDGPPNPSKDPNDSNNDPQDPNNSAGGGADDPSNIVIDGKTYYDGKILDDAQKNSVDRANSDSNLTAKDKSFMDDYYSAIDR